MKKETITESYEKAENKGNILNVKISMLNKEEIPFCEDVESAICLVRIGDGVKTFIGGNFSPKSALEISKCLDGVKEELLKAAIKMIAKDIEEEEK